MTGRLMDWGMSLHLIALGGFFPHDIVLLIFSLAKLLAYWPSVAANSTPWRKDKGRWFISSDASSLSKFFSFLTNLLVSPLGCQRWNISNTSSFGTILTFSSTATVFAINTPTLSHITSSRTIHTELAMLWWAASKFNQLCLFKFFCIRLQALVYQLLDEFSWAAERNEPAVGPALLETRLCHYKANCFLPSAKLSLWADRLKVEFAFYYFKNSNVWVF